MPKWWNPPHWHYTGVMVATRINFLFPFFIFSQVHCHHQWQTQNPSLSTPPMATPKKKKSQPKENPTISYTHKKKKFPIINTTTNHTNPPPSQPKLQTTTTNTENPNTPTQNLQIGDPKLPTQTHKHRKPKSKPRNP